MRGTTRLERNQVPGPDLLGLGGPHGMSSNSGGSLEVWELKPIPPCEGWELWSVGTSLPSRECFQGGC